MERHVVFLFLEHARHSSVLGRGKKRRKKKTIFDGATSSTSSATFCNFFLLFLLLFLAVSASASAPTAVLFFFWRILIIIFHYYFLLFPCCSLVLLYFLSSLPLHSCSCCSSLHYCLKDVSVVAIASFCGCPGPSQHHFHSFAHRAVWTRAVWLPLVVVVVVVGPAVSFISK